MKHLLFSLSLFASSCLLADTIQWLDNPANNNWNTSANWNATLSDSSDLVFNKSSQTNIDYTGTHTYNSITFSNNSSVYAINLRSQSSLTISGEGIKDYGIRTDPNESFFQQFYIRDGSALTFTDNANLNNTLPLRIVNTNGYVTFAGNSNAGNAYIVNTGLAGDPIPTRILFTGNSSAGSANITNYGAQESSVVFNGHSTSGSSRFTNAGEVSTIIFEEHANLGSQGGLVLNTSSYFQMLIRDNATLGGSARPTIYSRGSYGTTIISGNVTSIGMGSTFNMEGLFNTMYVRDNFKSLEGTFRIDNNGGTHSLVHITDNAYFAPGTSLTLLNRGNQTRILIDGDVEIYAGGNIGSAISDDNADNARPVYTQITGNTIIKPTSALNILSNGSHGTLLIDGNTVVEGATLGLGGANAKNATYIIAGNANVTSSTVFNANSTQSKVIIGGNASYTHKDGAAVHGFTITGEYTTVSIGENATYKKVGTGTGYMFVVNNAAAESIGINIGDNANITREGTNNSMFYLSNGKNTTVTISGNANVTQNTATANIVELRNATSTFIVTDNATISNGRMDMITAGSKVKFAGHANVDNASVYLRTGSTTLEIATDRGNVTLDNLYSASGGGTVHFTGPLDQTLTIKGSNNFTSLSFTDDGIIRGSITKNGTGTFTLDQANTITGNITAENGIILLNHLDAASMATLNFTSTGNINYGAAIGTNAITLGGIAGDGIFDTSLNGTRDYTIGANSYDSSFNGTLDGAGSITKIGNGTLTFNADTSAYTGASMTVEQGTLALFASALGSTAMSVKADAALRIGSGASNVSSLTVENGGILDIVVTKNNGTISNGNLFAGSLGNTSLADDVVYRATQNMSVSDQRLAAGDIIAGFLTTNDTNTVTEITAEGGQKDYGKVRSTNTMSFILNSTIVGGNAVLDLEVLTNSLAEYAANPNQAAIAGALDDIIQNHPNDPLSQLADNTSNVGAVLDTINPAGLSSMARLVYQQTNAEIDVISSRMDMQRHLNSALRQNRQISDAIIRVTSNIQSLQAPAASLLVQTKAIPEPGTQTNPIAIDAPYEDTPWSGYFATTGTLGKIDGDKDSAGYDARQAGITLGIDKPIGNNEGIAGLQLSYHNGKAELDKPSEGTVKLNSLRLAGYAGYLTRGGISLQAHAALAYHDYETERITYDNQSGNITLANSKGDTDGYGAAISGEIAKVFIPGKQLNWKHGPYARLTYDWLSIKGYDEAGTTTSLHYGKQTPDSLRSTLGWKFWYENTNASGTTLLLSARLGWAHEYSNPNQSISARFANYGAGFTVRGPDTRRDSLAYGLSAQWLLSSGRFITLQYQGDLNDDQSTHFLNAALGWKW